MLSRLCATAAVGLLAVLAAAPGGAAQTESEFSNPRIDFGLVARDAARTAGFLTNALGYKETRGFAVTPELGRKIGLIDGHAVNVRVFVAEPGEQAPRIKVLEFPAAPPRQPDQRFIHTSLGVRYLTLYVKDMKQSLARLKNAGVKLEGETPVDLGGGSYLAVVKDPDGNFFELIGPMKP